MVLSDYYMPLFRAPDALALLRRLGYDTPFIVVSGKIGEDAAVAMMQAGAQDYVTKENLARLCPAIERELREAAVRQEREKAEELARRAALAMDNAKLYEEAQKEIAERKRAEEELRKSEERFRATFHQAAVGVAHVGLDGRWLKVNERLSEIVGYPREELLNKTFQDITHPEDLEKDLGYVRRLLAGEIETYSMEKRYFKKDGSIVWINLTVSLVREAGGSQRTSSPSSRTSPSARWPRRRSGPARSATGLWSSSPPRASTSSTPRPSASLGQPRAAADARLRGRGAARHGGLRPHSAPARGCRL